MTTVVVTALYLLALVGVGVASNRRLRDTGADYFVASRSIGPVMMLLSMFGATMTSFAIVGSTGKAFSLGIGTYGLMASWAAVAHPLMFTVVGARAWQLGQRHGYVTQIQLLRDRFRSDLLGWLIFPVLVLLVLPYLLMGIQSAGTFFAAVTRDVFPSTGGMPPWATGLAVTVVTLAYIFLGGIRAAAWANALQTAIFLLVAVVTFGAITVSLGGPAEALAATAAKRPELLVRGEQIGQLHFLSYGLVGLSVGAFPHVFQHWLTARSDSDLKLSVVAHPILVMAVWLPCVLIGVWAAGQLPATANPNAVLGMMVAKFSGPWLSAVLSAGIVAAIMSSLDSQFMAIGTMFANDVVLHRHPDVTEHQKVVLGRVFVVLVALVSWVLSLFASRSVFEVGVWTFSGFSGLVPVFVAALYWKRATAAGAIASVVALVLTWGGFVGHALWTGAEGEPLVWGVMPVVFMLLASTTALVAVSLVTEPPPREVLARFFPDEAPEEPSRAAS